MQTEDTLTPQSLSRYLKTTYASYNSQQISNATSRLAKLYTQQPGLYILTLLSIVQSTDYINNSSFDDLKKAASKQLKSVSFKFHYLHTNQEQKSPVFNQLIPRLFTLLITPNLLTKGSKRYLSQALSSATKDNDQMENQVLTHLFTNLGTAKDPYILGSLKQICSAYVQNRQTPKDVSDLLNKLFPIIKMILTSHLEEFSQTKDAQKQKNCLNILDDYLNFLDATLVSLGEDDSEYGQLFHNLKEDAEFLAIFVQALDIGFKQSGSVIATQLITPHPNKVNKIKQLVFEVIEKVYVIDPIEIINMCIFSVFTCPTNSFSLQECIPSQLIIKCYDLLLKNIEFNQNYVTFSVATQYILTKCMILCKSTPEELQLIHQQPDKFVEVTDDFCGKREEYSIRMKSGEFIKAFCKKIDGSLIYVKTICCDVIRNTYLNTQMVYDITKTQLFLSSSVIKKQICLMILTLLYPMVATTVDSVNEMKAFLLEMIESFQQQTQLIVQLRIINLIGYCADFNYFPLVAARMKQQPEVLKFQSHSTFNRILRFAQLSPGQYSFIAHSLLSEIDQMEPSSKLFQTVVLENYSKLLQCYPQLKLKCVSRVIKQMVKISSSSHTVQRDEQIPFHQFQSMIQLETNEEFIQIMEKQFAVVLIKQNRRPSIQSNIFDIMTLFLTKLQKISQVHLDFSAQLQKNFYQYYELREFFLYINSFVYWNSASILPFQVLYQYLDVSILHKDTLMSPQVFLIGQMIYKHADIMDVEKVIKDVLKYYNECQLEITRGRLLNVILQGLMSVPDKILGILGEQNYNFVVKQITQNIEYFSQTLDQKICIMGLCNLLKMQGANNGSNVDMLVALVKMLDLQYRKIKGDKTTPVYLNYPTEEDQNAMEEEEPVEYVAKNRADSIEQKARMEDIVSFDNNYYNKFIHPITSYDQFAVFHEIWEMVKNLYIPQLNQEQSRLVRRVLDIKKVHQKTRRIVKIKRS